MEKIPPEILENILARVPPVQEKITHKYVGGFRWTQLSQYSTISRAWKASVERITFKKLLVFSDELDSLAALYSGDNISRRTVLTCISFRVFLPSRPNMDGCCNFVRAPDREADSAVFSTSITKLLAILAETGARAGKTPSLRFQFENAFRPSERDNPRRKPRECSYKLSNGCTVRMHTKQECWEAEAAFGQFELVNPEAVPTVHDITALDYWGSASELHDLKHTWIPEVVAKLPNLKSLHLATEDRYSDGRSARIARRESYASLIHQFAENHLSHISVDVRHPELKNEELPVHKLISPGKWDQETWHCMFNHLAVFPGLVVLRLLGGLVICPEFFRGIINQSDTPFPSLVELEVEISPETADGRWYLGRDDVAFEESRRDPEWAEYWEEMDESDWKDDEMSDWSDDYVGVFEDAPIRTGLVTRECFRSLPDSTTLLPFLLDASNAVLRIPKLKRFILKLGQRREKGSNLCHFPIINRVFELWYLKAGMQAIPYVPSDAKYLNQTRLYWRVDQWKPWEEVQAAWGAVVGPDAKIVWLNEDDWNYHSSFYSGDF